MSSTPLERLQGFWNERYAREDFVYGTQPNDFLVQMERFIEPRDARVLCLADGEGRNSVWLARQGWRVTALDVAERGLVKARALARKAEVEIDTVLGDVTRHELGESCWDAIASIFLHLPERPRRELHRRCIRALRPGGVFIFEAYSSEQLKYGTGGPKEIELLSSLASLLEDFAGCEIEHRYAGVRDVQEGLLHRGEGAVVQLLARKPG